VIERAPVPDAAFCAELCEAQQVAPIGRDGVSADAALVREVG